MPILSNNNELTIYSDKRAEITLIATEIRKLKAAFPAMESEFMSVLAERIQAKGFSEQRLKDAISSTIDNFIYQKPNIANIIGFDKRVKLYSYNEVTNLIGEHKASFDDFGKKKIGETVWRISKSDIEQYGIKDTF